MEISKTERVYRNLRKRIIDLELEPGQFIQKNDLIEEFGVSRAPINEALARLQEEDLVMILPQHGTFVQHITVSKLREGLFFRRAVEPHAIALIAPMASDDLIASLQENLVLQREAVEENDLSKLHVLDDRFHELLLSHGGFDALQKLVRTFGAHLERARNLAPIMQRQPRETLDDHEMIVRAISHRDSRWAQSAMDLHLASALAELAEMIEQEPAMFETDKTRASGGDEGVRDGMASARPSGA